MLPVWIRDDFVSDFAQLRDRARGARYRRWGSSPVLRSAIEPPPSLSEAVTERIGLCPVNGRARFHFNPARDRPRLYIHPDPTPYSGVLFLQSPSDCGTTFFRHRRTGLTYLPDPARLALAALERGEDPHAWAAMLVEDQYRSERWEPWLRVPARANRFVCFRGNLFHGPTDSRGKQPQNGRLLIAFFFEDSRDGGDEKIFGPKIKEASGATSPLIGKKFGWNWGGSVG